MAHQAHGHTHTARHTVQQLITHILTSALSPFSLDPPANSSKSFLARFLHEKFSEVNPAAGAAPTEALARSPVNTATARYAHSRFLVPFPAVAAEPRLAE
jgi:hypothetical protein